MTTLEIGKNTPTTYELPRSACATDSAHGVGSVMKGNSTTARSVMVPRLLSKPTNLVEISTLIAVVTLVVFQGMTFGSGGRVDTILKAIEKNPVIMGGENPVQIGTLSRKPIPSIDP